MKTEITENRKLNGWVFYDADCRWCVQLARRVRFLLARRHFKLLPLQSPWARTQLDLVERELLAEMRLLTHDGKVFGGVDALLEISRCYRLAWPVRQLARVPLVHKFLRLSYRWVARNRSCANGVCRVNAATPLKPNQPLDFLPLIILPVLALLFNPRVAPWVFMWLMALALFAGSKWLTYRQIAHRGLAQNQWREFGYLLAWPGMNAAEFFCAGEKPAKPRNAEWVWALAKTGFGMALLFGITRTLIPLNSLAAGWTGMCGAIFVLHFGVFHILSLAWRRAGVKAEPIMRNPLLAESLAEFWGRRWNTAFNELAFRFAYRPLRRWMVPAVATLGVFGLSGLIHELVISLPASGGYGLPTAYFLIQGLGLVLERSPMGHRIGLAKGPRGRLFTMAIIAGPVFWLFHPPFIHNVILPMLHAIGAT